MSAVWLAVYHPPVTASKKPRSHVRRVEIIFTAPTPEDADKMSHSMIATLFVVTGTNFTRELVKLGSG